MALFERERHPVARDGWVENYVWVREVPVHTIQSFLQAAGDSALRDKGFFWTERT